MSWYKITNTEPPKMTIQATAIESVPNIDTNTPVEDRKIFADGLKVGDAAQTTFSIGAKYKIIDGLRIYV